MCDLETIYHFKVYIYTCSHELQFILILRSVDRSTLSSGYATVLEAFEFLDEALGIPAAGYLTDIIDLK